MQFIPIIVRELIHINPKIGEKLVQFKPITG